MIDATLYPYDHALIHTMLKNYIVLSLGDHNTYFP